MVNMKAFRWLRGGVMTTEWVSSNWSVADGPYDLKVRYKDKQDNSEFNDILLHAGNDIVCTARGYPNPTFMWVCNNGAYVTRGKRVFCGPINTSECPYKPQQFMLSTSQCTHTLALKWWKRCTCMRVPCTCTYTFAHVEQVLSVYMIVYLIKIGTAPN